MSQYKNHKAITLFHIRERKDFREKLSEEEKAEVSLYLDEENHFVNGHTPLTIPKKYSILVVDKFYCKWCQGYHAAKKGSYLCKSNPDYEKNVTANRTKAADYYYKKGRKTAINHGNNIHKADIIRRVNNLNEYLKNNPEVRKRRAEKTRNATKHVDRPKILEYARRCQRIIKEKRRLISENQYQQPNYVPHDFFGAMNTLGQIKNSIDNFNSVDFKPKPTYDEFTGRHYDNNGDFDPFS